MANSVIHDSRAFVTDWASLLPAKLKLNLLVLSTCNKIKIHI